MAQSITAIRLYGSIYEAYVIEPSALFREHLTQFLNCEQFRVTLSRADASSAICNLGTTGEVDVILLSVGPDFDATLSDLRQLRAAFPRARIVVLSTEMSLPVVSASLKAGADAFLLKDLSAEALMLSLKLVMQGEKVLSTPFADLLASMDLAEPAAAGGSGENRLSKREVEILERIVRGESNKHIASAINITEGTVKVHVTNLLRKIKVQNRTQAALWAREHRLVPRQSRQEPPPDLIAAHNL
jgi:two-component system nitrate/nitrite response regulator NarL